MRASFIIAALVCGLLYAPFPWALGGAAAQPDAGPGISPSMTSGMPLGTPPGMASRLAAQRVGSVEAGTYSMGDQGSFVLEPYEAGKYLLRFSTVPENFVLTAERGTLGARILKYDTGATALRVSVWGGLTVYTQGNPQGVPAMRLGDAPPLLPPAVSAPELLAAFGDEAGHLTYVQRIAVRFSADPAVMQATPATRGCAFDALTNAVLGIERFVAALPARVLFARRITSVKVAEGGKPTVSLTGNTLLVSFVPGEGEEGHASSLAIQQELGKLLTPPRDAALK